MKRINIHNNKFLLGAGAGAGAGGGTILSPLFVSGFIDGEASFILNI